MCPVRFVLFGMLCYLSENSLIQEKNETHARK